MEAVFIDTHIVVWLFYGETQALSQTAAKAIEQARLFISPISLLELDYLNQIKRISHDSSTIFADLAKKIDLEVADGSFGDIVREATTLTWTRDLFDRLIVAHAHLKKSPLITKDRLIRKHVHCIW